MKILSMIMEGTGRKLIGQTQDKVRQKRNTAVTILAVIGIIAILAAAVYALYRFMQPDYFEGYDDDEDDDFDYDEDLEDDSVIDDSDENDR